MKKIFFLLSIISNLIFVSCNRNYNLETINGKIYIYGMARTTAELEEVVKEAKLIPDVVEVVPSIILADNLSRKNYL